MPVRPYQIDYSARWHSRERYAKRFSIDFDRTGSSAYPVMVLEEGYEHPPAANSGVIAAVSRTSMDFDAYVKKVAEFVLLSSTKDAVAAKAVAPDLVAQWDAHGISNPFVTSGPVTFTQRDVVAFAASVDLETPSTVKAKWGRCYLTVVKPRLDEYPNRWMYAEDYRNPNDRETLHVGFSYPLTTTDQASNIAFDVGNKAEGVDRSKLTEAIHQALTNRRSDLWLPDGTLSAPAAMRIALGMTPELAQSKPPTGLQSGL